VYEPCPGVNRPVLVQKVCTMPATPLSWLLALDRWLCVPAFQRVCPRYSKVNMPKKMSRDKRRRRSMRSAAAVKTAPIHSVKELLSAVAPALTRVTEQAARANFWSAWLCRHLPTVLSARISGVIERDDTLVIFAISAAWSARLRFALQELEPQLRAASPGLAAISVRVRPATSRS